MNATGGNIRYVKDKSTCFPSRLRDLAASGIQLPHKLSDLYSVLILLLENYTWISLAPAVLLCICRTLYSSIFIRILV